MQHKQNKAQVEQKETKGSPTKIYFPVTYTEWIETGSTGQYSEGPNFCAFNGWHRSSQHF